jgi:hypothetical protein
VAGKLGGQLTTVLAVEGTLLVYGLLYGFVLDVDVGSLLFKVIYIYPLFPHLGLSHLPFSHP